MTAIVAAGAALGVFLTVVYTRPSMLVDRVAPYLRRAADEAPAEAVPLSAAAAAGLGWSQEQTRWRRLASAGVGALIGLLAVQGDLFVEDGGRSAPALIAVGAASGWLLFGMYLSTRAERRGARLRHELPIVCEVLALHVLAGESVSMSVVRLTESAQGVAADELRVALEDADSGSGMTEALHTASKATVDPEASRLYTLLAHAHVSGGRLAGALSELAKDYRAAIADDLTREGGRRAITTYGPVLGLMVPVTLLFLLYPTITGLRSLAP